MTGLYRIADKNIEISSLYPTVHTLCRGYRTEGVPDLRVQAGPGDIAFERSMTGESFSEGYLEMLAVHRQIADAMPAWDTLMFHGSAIAADGFCYLFTAPSGTGKSTHTRLWRELLGDRARMINDDKPLLHVGEGGVTVYGTPWNGKHSLGENSSAPLRAICFLERGKENVIRRVTRDEVLFQMIGQIYRPRTAEALARTMALADKLCARTALYRLSCNMEPDAARLSFETMSESAAPVGRP